MALQIEEMDFLQVYQGMLENNHLRKKNQFVISDLYLEDRSDHYGFTSNETIIIRKCQSKMSETEDFYLKSLIIVVSTSFDTAKRKMWGSTREIFSIKKRKKRFLLRKLS